MNVLKTFTNPKKKGYIAKKLVKRRGASNGGPDGNPGTSDKNKEKCGRTTQQGRNIQKRTGIL